MSYPAPSVVQLVPKHGLKDCVIAALASYLAKPYEEVVAATARVYPNFFKCGVTSEDCVKIAGKLGAKTRWARDYDIDEDSGVLCITYLVGPGEHVVLLLDGRIYELEDNPITSWEPDTYMTAHGARAGLLLVRLPGK